MLVDNFFSSFTWDLIPPPIPEPVEEEPVAGDPPVAAISPSFATLRSAFGRMRFRAFYLFRLRTASCSVLAAISASSDS